MTQPVKLIRRARYVWLVDIHFNDYESSFVGIDDISPEAGQYLAFEHYKDYQGSENPPPLTWQHKKGDAWEVYEAVTAEGYKYTVSKIELGRAYN